jgi:NifU-like protein involved in Fe-S cluster formation
MQDAVTGQNRAGVAKAAAEMAKMLNGEKPSFPAGWERLSVLAPIKDHTARHNAVMLPFEAIEKAFKNKA